MQMKSENINAAKLEKRTATKDKKRSNLTEREGSE